MDNLILESAGSRVKPWTVLMISGGQERILKRFKSKVDADCYAIRLNQVATDGIVYCVRFLCNKLPTANNGN